MMLMMMLMMLMLAFLLTCSWSSTLFFPTQSGSCPSVLQHPRFPKNPVWSQLVGLLPLLLQETCLAKNQRGNHLANGQQDHRPKERRKASPGALRLTGEDAKEWSRGFKWTVLLKCAVVFCFQCMIKLKKWMYSWIADTFKGVFHFLGGMGQESQNW